MARGRPFTGKDDPRRGKSSGRPRKSVTWKEAEDALREALPRIMLMPKNELQQLLASNPTGAEMLAAKFIHESPNKAVERMLGRMPEIFTGAGGAPLIPASAAPSLPPISFVGWSPEQIDKFIEATKPPPRAKQEPPTTA